MALKPAAVIAGSNVAEVGKATDDDETTHWASDGVLADAWMEFQYDQPQRVDEVVLKLIGWRLRSYPLRITLDGQVVFEGVAPKSLGYVTLPLKAGKAGRKLRIALTAPTEDRDAFGKIVEITGARAGLDTGAEKVKAGGALGGDRGGGLSGPVVLRPSPYGEAIAVSDRWGGVWDRRS